MKLVKELSENDQELLWWRSGLENADDAVICLHHGTRLLKNVSVINFTKCCNIFQVHEHGASSKDYDWGTRVKLCNFSEKLSVLRNLTFNFDIIQCKSVLSFCSLSTSFFNSRTTCFFDISNSFSSKLEAAPNWGVNFLFLLPFFVQTLWFLVLGYAVQWC